MTPGQPRCFTRLTIDDDLLRYNRVGFHWWNGSFILTRVITDTPGSRLSVRRFLKDQSLTRIDPDWFNRSTMSWRRLVYLLLSDRGFSVAYWFIPGFRVPFLGESSGFSYRFSLNKAFLLRRNCHWRRQEEGQNTIEYLNDCLRSRHTECLWSIWGQFRILFLKSKEV